MANTLNVGNGNWGVKKDSLLGYNSENGNYKPLPFDFTRASSATVVNKDGLIETVGNDISRIDYTDSDKGALLLEPQRTNLIPYSNGFDNVAWEKGASGTASAPIVSANQGISPDGLNNAFKVELNLNGGTTSSDRSRLTDNFTGVTSTYYTFSFYAKAYSSSDVGKAVKFSVDNSSGDALFTLTSEWKRFVFVGLSSGTNINQHIQLRGNENTSDSVTMLLYGYQAEEGSYPTSYIPTQGSAVTRLADSCSQTVPDGVIGQTEGTILVDVDFKTLIDTNMFVSIRPDASNKIEIYRSDAVIYGEFSSDASFNFNKPSVTVGRYKIAVAYSSGSSAMYINGVLIGSNTTSFAFTSTLDGIYINSRGTTFIEQSSYNDVKLYNTRLSNAELQALTS